VIPVVFITGQGTIPMMRARDEGRRRGVSDQPFSEEELLAAIGQALERDAAARRERCRGRGGVRRASRP
jgi:FixJ family two-component response regulator